MIVPPESYKVVNYSYQHQLRYSDTYLEYQKSSEFTKAYCIMPRPQLVNKTCSQYQKLILLITALLHTFEC
jgi:hypothetical protein